MMNKKLILWLGGIIAVLFIYSNSSSQTPFQVTHETTDVGGFAWSPAGTQFVYSVEEGDIIKLARIDLDGTNKTILTDDVYSIGACVDWKGSVITFMGKDPTKTSPYDRLVKRINPDGTNETIILSPYWYGAIILRPGGNWVLFNYAPNGWWIVKRCDLNGGNIKTVSHSALVQHIGWFGKTHILYARGANYYTPCRLYKVNFDGGDLKELTPSDLPNNAQFSGSPDTSKILYIDGTTTNRDIWIMNFDGSNKTQLTTNSANDNLSFPLQHIWTSDCKSFFFVSERTGNLDIFKMNIDGSGLTRITFSDSLDGTPTLSPDGTKLAFLSKRDGYSNIWVIDFEAVHVFIPDTTEEGDKIVDIPVRVTDVTNKGIYSFGMTIKTDPNILIPQGAVSTGTLSESWGNATFNINGGIIKLAIAGSSPLAGSGTLIYLRYKVPAAVAQDAITPIAITDFIFNDGQPAVVTHDGSFKVIWKFDVSGKIKYYNNDIPIPRVDVSLNSHQTATDNNGDFQFFDIFWGYYTSRPDKIGSSAHAVGPYDAALILMSSVQLITLTPYQKIAGDVSGNGDVSALDASYVLRYYVGFIPKFPVGKDWTFVPTSFPINDTNWSTAPDTIRYAPMNSDKTDQDFVGIVYGDVSGNWQLPRAASEYWLAQSSSNPQLSVGNLQQEKEGRYILPLTLANVSDLISVGLTCDYDQNQFHFVAVELKTVSSSQPMIFYNDSNGKIRVGIAAANPINDRAPMIRFVFTSTSTIEKTPTDPLSIQEISINGKHYQAHSQHIETNLERVTPDQYELSQNYPNPFNAETLIKYQLPKSGYVTIKIYNLLGQKIRTLVTADKEAGFHQIIWNGRDDWNEAVGSGEYLCQMRAGDYVVVRKVVLIR